MIFKCFCPEVFLEHRRCPRHCGTLFTGKAKFSCTRIGQGLGHSWQEAARHLAHECPNRKMLRLALRFKKLSVMDIQRLQVMGLNVAETKPALTAI